jgi:hypothetical protein
MAANQPCGARLRLTGEDELFQIYSSLPAALADERLRTTDSHWARHEPNHWMQIIDSGH